MFDKIRKVLDDIEKYDADCKRWNLRFDPRNGIPNSLEDKLVLAMYDELNIYYIGRKLKALSDMDIPGEYKSAMLDYLREKNIEVK